MPEKVIPITKAQIGHVLGKGGATLKSIQAETGAKLTIVNDGPAVMITADEQAMVDTAEEAVRRIVANQENPDYEGPEGSRLRKEANALGDRRSKLYDEATAKRSAGDHEAANRLVAEGKQAGEDMQARHREAAAAIAKYNNGDKGKDENYFDMHGLREEEALGMLKTRTAALEAKPAGTVTEFEVIPGAGHHSAPGAQKLKGATEAFFKEKGYPYEAISAGSLMVKVPGSGAGEPPAKKPKAEQVAAPGVPGAAEGRNGVASKKPAAVPDAAEKFGERPKAASPPKKVAETRDMNGSKRVGKEKPTRSCCAVM